MSDSMFGSLLNMLDKHTVGEVANALGQPQASVARAMESSVATILGGVASKSEDSGALQKLLEMVPSTGAISWSQIASSVADPNSSLMATGKRLLTAIFGSSEKTVTSGISRESGLPSGAIATLLSMAATLVMSFISKRVREGGMTMDSLASALQRESATIKSALPAGLSDLFWPATATAAATASPVVAQAVQRESSFNWLPIIAIAGLGLGLLWFLSHARRPSIDQVVPSTAVGTANRIAVPLPKTTCTVSGNVNIPENGAAARLLAFVRNPESNTNAWFSMDQIAFDSGSATLRPESQAQLDNIATVLSSCPSIHLDIAGFTDNVGSAASNLRLSQKRAGSVVAQLVNKGVSRDRLTAEGYGEDDPIADNSAEQGRAHNRRVAMRVAQQ